MERARPLKIVEIIDNNFQLNIISLKALQKPKVKNRKVVVISVAGAFRKGKSFLLGFILRYLYAQYVYKDISKWIGKEDDIIKGFTWRGGPERTTTGILMWSDIFLYDSEHGNIAIVVLDTQGVFDNESTTRDCAFIFALSTLISSVQIYNISQNIQETDLQHLHLFTEFGKFALESSDNKPFQKLQFLIRDWSYPKTYTYGADGGFNYLQNCLKITDNLPKELKSVREFIKTSFSEVGCFLMPHPGLSVSRDTFTGQIKEIDNLFQTEIQNLVPLLLSPENLILKKVNGEYIRAKDLISFFKIYVKALRSDDIVTPSTITDVTIEANHMVLFDKYLELYMDNMQTMLNNSIKGLKEDDMKEKHTKFSNECIHLFDSSKKMGNGSEITLKYRNNLCSAIEEKFKFYQKCNETNSAKYRAKRKNKHLNAMNNYLEQYKTNMNKIFFGANSLDDNVLEQHHLFISKTVLKDFLSLKKEGDDHFTQVSDTLRERMYEGFIIYKTQNSYRQKLEKREKEAKTAEEKATAAKEKADALEAMSKAAAQNISDLKEQIGDLLETIEELRENQSSCSIL